jgi:hypothetical protein
MTTEYLRGEVLHLLNWAQRSGPGCGGTDRVWGELRREAESSRIDDLSWVVERALAVAEAGCWEAFTADDAAAFRDRAYLAAALFDFGICSNLLPMNSGDFPPAQTMIWRKGHLP